MDENTSETVTVGRQNLGGIYSHRVPKLTSTDYDDISSYVAWKRNFKYFVYAADLENYVFVDEDFDKSSVENDKVWQKQNISHTTSDVCSASNLTTGHQR